MNILQVSENYSAGGLEKFIDAFSEELVAQGCKSFLALGNLNPEGKGPRFQQGVFDGFGFKNNAAETIREFVSDVEKLCEIIEREKIDMMMIHPFFSLFPAMAATKMMGVPCAYVVHGIRSCSFPISPIDDALFRISVDLSADHVFTTQMTFKNYLDSNVSTSILRNPVSIGSEMRDGDSPLLENNRWALCSRLDKDKESAIKNVISWMQESDISFLDVYGKGSCRENLVAFAKEHEVDDRIIWHGHKDDWLDEVRANDTGVIGLGRVAIEALAANIPVLLLGVEGGVCGLVDEHLYDLSKDSNFGRIGIPTLTSAQDLKDQLDEFRHDPKPFLFGKTAIHDFAASAAVSKCLGVYQDLVTGDGVRKVPGWSDFIRSLKLIPDQNKAFTLSPLLAYLIKDCFLLTTPTAAARNATFIAEQWADAVLYREETDARLFDMATEQINQDASISEQADRCDVLEDRICSVEGTLDRVRASKPYQAWRLMRSGKNQALKALDKTKTMLSANDHRAN